MKKVVYLATAAFAIAAPQAAFANDGSEVEVTVGVNAGVHDLGIKSDIEDALAGVDGADDLDIDDTGELFGGFIAVDVPVGESFFIGAEGNANFGGGPIDSEYGIAARVGFRTEDGMKFYVRGGYQEVDFDVLGVLGIDDDEVSDDVEDTLDGLDTTEGDYLVGAGLDVPLGEQFIIRGNVDTIAFDTLRATVGVGFKF